MGRINKQRRERKNYRNNFGNLRTKQKSMEERKQQSKKIDTEKKAKK